VTQQADISFARQDLTPARGIDPTLKIQISPSHGGSLTVVADASHVPRKHRPGAIFFRVLQEQVAPATLLGNAASSRSGVRQDIVGSSDGCRVHGLFSQLAKASDRKRQAFHADDECNFFE
jgi:hypothetical protein